MSRACTAALYRLAWRTVPHLPGWLGYAVFHTAGDVVWLWHQVRRGDDGVGQLERNLARLLPGQEAARGLARASRAAMRSYMRYFYEAFALPSLTPGQVVARVRVSGDTSILGTITSSSVVLALPHMGNWDLVAAWACQEVAPLLTVAERLEPEDLFNQFTRFRERLGMRIIGQGRGEKVFDRLLEAAGQGRYLIALLADRDLSSSGVRADLGGYPFYAAAGPAALAQRLDLPLYVATIHYERLAGYRRRRAGSPWGVVLTLREVPVPPDSVSSADRVERHTRAWVRAAEPLMAEHPVDWHMLQPVFEADLDPQRLARSRSRGGGELPLGTARTRTGSETTPGEAVG